METIDLGALIQDALARFSRNRIGEKPPVSLVLSSGFTPVSWPDPGLSEFVRFFIYDTLLSSDPDAPIKIALRERLALNDLSAFLRIKTPGWVQLQIRGRGLKILDRFVEELFADVGYRRDEWVGVEGSSAQLGIFSAVNAPARKLVFCLEKDGARITGDLLAPLEAQHARSTAIAAAEKAD